MPMVEMQLGDQTIRYDRDSTVRIYASTTNGWAERCGCVGCRNYLAQRDEIYPPVFRELLDRLGIEPNKEAEVVADGPLKNGLYHYGGWFFLVGVVTAGEHISEVCDSPYFSFFFTRVAPCPKEFRGVEPRIAIEFEAHFKWILAESWDSDFRPAAGRTEGPGPR